MSRSSGIQRSKSRAETAMEKHKERMRKASLQMAPQNAATQHPRQQLTPKLVKLVYFYCLCIKFYIS